MNSPKLAIELVPETSWYTNVRSNVSKEAWDAIRKAVYRRANYACEICGGKGDKWPVECHEVWDYDDISHKQILRRMIALCPDCHQVKHIGLANIQGSFQEALAHLMRVNNWSRQTAEEYVNAAFEQWQLRSQHQWKIDTSIIDDWLKAKGLDTHK